MLSVAPFFSQLFSSSVWSSLASLVDLLNRVFTMTEDRRLQGIYEVLDQQRTVTILDAAGRAASVDTVQHVRFRQNHVTALTEYAWGEGSGRSIGLKRQVR